MPPPPKPDEPTSEFERPDTVLVTDDDIRQALLSGLKGRFSRPCRSSRRRARGGRRSRIGRRPGRRSPMLTVFDDGKIDGEVIRIREPSVRHRPHRGGPPHSRSTAGCRRGTSRSPTRSSAGCTAGSSPTSRARTGCSSASAARSWPTRPSSSSATAATGSTPPQADPGRDDRPRPGRAGLRRDPGLGRRAQPVPPAGPDRAARQRDRQPHPAGQARILDRLRPDLPDLPPRRPVLRAAARPALPRPEGGLARRAQQDAERALAADVADHRRVDGPVPDRRAAVPAQGEVKTRDVPDRRPAHDATARFRPLARWITWGDLKHLTRRWG